MMVLIGSLLAIAALSVGHGNQTFVGMITDGAVAIGVAIVVVAIAIALV